ncbi:enoyl-CoA hydratase [Chelatococcus reniformis]|uniref:Enoyl-CoA hydratase n=1 Tax=Chelatococcus reniformis TaxID=1494448 RepID=A0A916XNB1_9HYPH|nr:enoyl-CoA hydratase [Chelatococcus reniformis]GGC89273.1 enoyl-CoA hydratase [Chelatococcus reniformis]
MDVQPSEAAAPPVVGRIEHRRAGPVGQALVSNPSKLNALSLGMWEDLERALSDFEGDREVRCVVIAGQGGKAFASGADISEFEKRRSSAADVARYDEISKSALVRLTDFSKPTIAQIEGYCIGGGMALALSCDLRIAADDARFAIPAAKLGLGYDYRGIQRLVDLVGPSAAKHIFFTARQFGTDEALRLGIVNEVVPKAELAERTADLAAAIARNAPMTIAAAKLCVANAVAHPEKRDLKACAQAVGACFASEDYAEGRRAFAEKRRPVFKGR